MIRPIFVATIGFIIGIILGLYFEKGVVLFCFVISMVAIFILISSILKSNKNIKRDFKLFSFSRYFRYVKLFLDFKVIVLILISSIIGCKYIVDKNNVFEYIYANMQKSEKIEIEGIIVSEKTEKEYKDIYEVKVENKKFFCYINKKKNIELEYGDRIKIKGKYNSPNTQRNTGGFDYETYLKSRDIYGIIQANDVDILEKNCANFFMRFINKIRNHIKEKSKNIKNKSSRSIYLALILGDSSEIQEDVQEQFKIAGLAHVLAVSGMHMSYIILGSVTALKRLFGKRYANLIACLIIIFYMIITGFSSSIARAGIMGVILLFSKFIYRKNDVVTNISFSALVILMINPFLITDVGFQFTYAGTIGIILYKNIISVQLQKFQIKSRRILYKIPKKIIKIVKRMVEIISITLAAQVLIMPILLYHFNLFSSYFIITNLLTTIVIGPIFVIGIAYTISIFFSSRVSLFLSKVLGIGIDILKFISEIPKHLFKSKIYLPTLKIYQLILYYLLIFIGGYVFIIKKRKKKNMTQMRILNLIGVIKYKYRETKKCKKEIFSVLIILVIIIITIMPRKLKINFIDVGQGDSTFIVTPTNKTILIDGGGSENSDFDIGEYTLLPYILDRGYTKIDYIVISHFDYDHIGGIFTILEELEVGQVIISKQIEMSDNYEKFLKLVNSKRLNVRVVKKGDLINIEKDCFFKVLWPSSEYITKNVLNNNAIVMKFKYKEFSCLFTGDIEKEAEEKIIENINEKELRSTVLKVAHHGSKTSSTERFLKYVNPKVVLIGVGRNNIFGHPNQDVIERIQSITNQIFRTDLNGEIMIEIDKKSKYTIKTKI